jgi:hypothetical protein
LSYPRPSVLAVIDPGGGVVNIDCDSCAMRGPVACGDCVVTVLLGAPPEGVELDDAERRAIEALADGGLIPPLRLVPDERRSGHGRRSPHVA